MSNTRTLDLAQAAHNLRVTARNYAHDFEHDPARADESWAALERAAITYAHAEK